MTSHTTKRWALAIHGGAGTIERQDDPLIVERYQQALFGCLECGTRVLAEHGNAIDAVEISVRALEDEPLFNAGRGAVFTSLGTIELDAAIMDGRDLSCGAVVGLTGSRNPISVARRVMSHTPHVMLAGSGANAFAAEQGFDVHDASYFYTDARWRQLEQARREQRVALDHDIQSPSQPSLGTVGAVAYDTYGNVAAATSTGGMTNKLCGRVGDTPLIGAGTYANNASCAVSATGHGEYFIRATVARDVAAMMEYGGHSLRQAAQRKVMEELKSMGGSGGIIAVDHEGTLCLVYNSLGMYRAWARDGEPARAAIHD